MMFNDLILSFHTVWTQSGHLNLSNINDTTTIERSIDQVSNGYQEENKSERKARRSGPSLGSDK
jgi:hypothetical protein